MKPLPLSGRGPQPEPKLHLSRERGSCPEGLRRDHSIGRVDLSESIRRVEPARRLLESQPADRAVTIADKMRADLATLGASPPGPKSRGHRPNLPDIGGAIVLKHGSEMNGPHPWAVRRRGAPARARNLALSAGAAPLTQWKRIHDQTARRGLACSAGPDLSRRRLLHRLVRYRVLVGVHPVTGKRRRRSRRRPG